MAERLIVWGAGELGGRVAALWNGPVLGFTETSARHDDLLAAGVEPRLGSAAPRLKADDCLLLALPGYQNQQLALEALVEATLPARVVIISSTGYYGIASGRVTVDTPPGTSERAQAIAQTEALFHKWTNGRGVIVRLGGLYRLGRGPFSAFAKRRRIPEKPPESKLPLIHYDDAARAVHQVLIHPQPRPVYLGITLPCPTRREFYTAACQT
ncbi:MAG: hypothetical protein KDE51_14305, partial [Anaerolineales bacterium]|nr:hypothetical protein [Anaerolineales bacterium]